MKKLYEGNLRKNFFVFAFPLVISALLSQGYNIINTIVVGKLIGDNGISAIGSTAPFISFVSSLFWGYSTGFSIYVAMLFGKGAYSKMVNIIKINIIVSSVILLCGVIMCIIFHNQFFDILKIEDSIRNASFAYFSVYACGLIFLHINWSGIYIANAIGISKAPLALSIISNVLNIVMNFVFIKKFGMGVEGTALATVFSAFFVSVIYFFLFVKICRKLNVKITSVYFNKNELKTSLSYAVPTMLQQSVMYLSTALVSPLTNSCGASAIAGYTVGMRLYDLNAAVYQNSNKTVSNYIAQCIGGDKASMIKKGIRTGLAQTLIFLSPFLIATVFGSRFICSVFLDTAESIGYADMFMRFCMPFVIFNVINNLIHAIFRSTGAGKYLVTSTLVYAVSRFVYSYILFGRYEIYGIYAAIVLSWITEAIYGMCIYLSGKWKKNKYMENAVKQSAIE